MSQPTWKSIRWRCCIGPEDAFDSDWGRSLPFWEISWDSLPAATREQWVTWNPAAWSGTHGSPVGGEPARWELLELTHQDGETWAIEVWNRPRLHLAHPNGRYQDLHLLMASALENTPGGAWEWDATTDGPELPRIFLPLEHLTCPYPQKEMDHFLPQNELAPLAVAALELAITRAIEDPCLIPDDYLLAIHLSTLLGIWKEHSAFRPLVHLLEQDAETVDALLTDFTTEHLPTVLAATAGDEAELLVNVVEHSGGALFHRLAAVDALAILAKKGLFAGLPKLLGRWMENPPALEDEDTLDWPEMLAGKAVDLRLVQYRDLIRRITDNPPRPFQYIDWEWAEEKLGLPPDDDSFPSDDCGNIPLQLAKWHCFTEKAWEEQRQHQEREAAFARLEHPDHDGQVTLPIARTTPKIGRNDPCPCGSGKKFKKCCGG